MFSMGISIYSVLICLFLSMAEGSPQLLFANRKDLRLVDINNGKANVSVLISNLDDATAVDFILSTGQIFWTDISLEVIKGATIGRIQQTTSGIITTGLISPDGLACDWVGQKLYWTDAETNRIEVSQLDGTDRKVLYWENLDQPRAIALDPYSGLMFWSDWGEVRKIERAGMDGTLSTRSVIINDNIYWPNGLTLDYQETKIYWADAKLGFIHSCNFDGWGRRAVIDQNLPHPFALTLFRDTLYWTDWQTKSIHSCNKKTGGDLKVVLRDIHSPMDIHAYDAERQDTGYNPCGTNNGGCSHLCLMSPTKPKYKCACPTGVRLLEDDRTCADGAEEMLLLARRIDLRRISLDTPDFTDVVLQLDNIKHAIAIDYDPLDGYVYWTDDEVHAIRRAFLNGTGEEVLVDKEVDHPDGIAIDWIGRNLYWTDTGTDRIEVCRLNGTSRKILISEDLDEPRALCLDPEQGYMWWTDWGLKAKIERAYMDGSNRETIISKDLGWPNGVAVDQEQDKIYWCDAKFDRIEVANMDGTERRVFVKENLPHCFGFSLLHDYIYWTDWQRRSIERVNKNTGGNRTRIINQLPDMMGLKAINVKRIKGTSPCSYNNGGCSHLCLHTPKGARCACPMGLELISKGKKCIVPEAFLLFTRDADVKRMSLSTTHQVMTIPLKGIEKALAIDFDISDNRIYWTDRNMQSISRAFMNGSSVQKIIEFGMHYPEGMVVDWVAKNIYWADSGTKRIEMARLDGSSRRVLVWKNLSHPRAIAIDPPNGYMYWTDWSVPPKLERANLDGTDRKVIIENIGRVYDLTIDYDEKRLFWADMDYQRIETSDLLGENRTVVVSDDVPNPMALTQYQGNLYWTDWTKQVIEQANKTTGGNRSIIQDGVDKVTDIVVFHSSRQFGWNGCSGNNGECSHLCHAMPDKYKAMNVSRRCSCPTHYHTLPNGKCQAPKSFLLFSQRNDINLLVVEDTDEVGIPEVVLPIKGLRKVRALDFDPIHRHIYWISGRSESIKRSTVEGKQIQNVISGNNAGIKPFDLAIDPYSHTIFWSCSQTNMINFMRIDKRAGGVVVNGTDRKPSQKPRYLAINPHKGHLYWTNQANPATIQRALLDGTEAVSLFHSGGLSNPGPLTVDPKSGLLFWADLEEKVIECSDWQGGNRRVLVNGKSSGRIKDITGLAVYGEYLYWADKDKKCIGKVQKSTGKEFSYVQDCVSQISDLHAAIYLSADDVKQHPCGRNNGNCSHLCIAKTSRQIHCSCPKNLRLKSDGQTCTEKPACSPEQFTCLSGECIPKQWQCDGAAECRDKSDELDCVVSCASTEFQCKDGTCIPRDEMCDVRPFAPDIFYKETVDNIVVVRGTEGQPVTLTCTSSGGYPAPSVAWYKDSTTIPSLVRSNTGTQEGGTYTVVLNYTFTPTASDDGHVYLCLSYYPKRASLDAQKSSVTLYLYLKPSIPTVTQPSSSTVECRTSGSRPAASISWRYQGQSYTPQVVTTPESEDKFTVVSTLTRQFAATDNGQTIRCVVTHQALVAPTTELTRDATLNVPFSDGSTSITGNREVTANGTSTLTLTCTTGSSSPASDIKWYNGATLLSNNAPYTSKPGTNNGIVRSQDLILTPTRHMNGDIITCEVWYNSQPKDADQETLNIKCSPTHPSDVRILDYGETSANISWIPGFPGGRDQTFIIQISTDNNSWKNVSSVPGGQDISGRRWYKRIDGLSGGTEYHVRMYAYNSEGRSEQNSASVSFVTTQKIADPQTGSPIVNIIGGAVGGVVVIAIVILLAVFLAKRYKYTIARKDNATSDDTHRVRLTSADGAAASNSESVQTSEDLTRNREMSNLNDSIQPNETKLPIISPRTK